MCLASWRGLQCGAGDGFSAGLSGEGPYVLWRSYIVLVVNWSLAMACACILCSIIGGGGGGGGGGNSPLIQIVTFRIMARPVRYCYDLVYSEFIMLYIFL